MMPRNIRKIWLGVAGVFLLPLMLAGQEVPVSVRVHYPLLLKTLSFDHTFADRARSGINLGILYDGTSRVSRQAKDELFSLIQNEMPQMVDGVPLRAVPIELSADAGLRDQLAGHDLTALYVTPLGSGKISTVITATRKMKVLTLTGVPSYVEEGLSIGIRDNDGQPSLIVNVTAAAAEGAQLDSQLLSLAKIVR